MKKLTYIFSICFWSFSLSLFAQQAGLTVEKIMQDPKSWVGSAPSEVFWSDDSKTIYFKWNPEQNEYDSLYRISAPWNVPVKVSKVEREGLRDRRAVFNHDKSKMLFVKEGDIFLLNVKKDSEQRLMETVERESDPVFLLEEDLIAYRLGNNLFTLNTKTGKVTQLTNISLGVSDSERGNPSLSEQDEWLKKDQEGLFDVLSEGENRSRFMNEESDSNPLKIMIPKGFLRSLDISPDGRYVTYSVYVSADGKSTVVPDFVTESGYTENLRARSKVGGEQASIYVSVYDVQHKSLKQVNGDNLPGIDKAPEYYKLYNRELEGNKEVYAFAPKWSADGKHAVMIFRSVDNKDRWLAELNPATGEVAVIDHQHDEAWISGPGIGWTSYDEFIGWLPDNKHVYFQSEATGYSHLYLYNIESGIKTALTSGKFEIYKPRISPDKKKWYFEANVDHPGIVQVYELPLMGGDLKKVTDLGGKAEGTLSPDGKKLAVIHSTANHPEELYVIDNLKTKQLRKLTESTTEEWRTYDWMSPEFITFEAEDGAEVYARLYKPEEGKAEGQAVIFVHGAGYLQNAHQWWSSYFREYMFHNLLVEKGYIVLDIDYRGSAGYGRDWRTGIYRHMGGKDLSDQVDGARYLVEKHGIDPERIGIYGGSYGGFITLMAMFNESETFAAGAALRSVTDWAHYNHGYTSNILNTPVLDSIAYHQSSPIYFAEGLKGDLLICHGMIDTNVHFQDVVRLAQRLIELGKDDWEFAVFPKEGHGFSHPSSWTDEYSRILKLFERTLRKE